MHKSNVASQTKKQEGVSIIDVHLNDRCYKRVPSIYLPVYLPIHAPRRAELLFTFHYLNFLESRCLKRNPFAYCVSFLNRLRAIVKLNFVNYHFTFFHLVISWKRAYGISSCYFFIEWKIFCKVKVNKRINWEWKHARACGMHATRISRGSIKVSTCTGVEQTSSTDGPITTGAQSRPTEL